MIPGGFGFFPELGRDIRLFDILPEIVVIDDRAHVEEVDHAGEIALKTDRQLNRSRLGLEPIDDHRQGVLERCTGAIELVDEADPRHTVLVSLTPHRLRLWLDAGHAIEHDNATIEHSQ